MDKCFGSFRTKVEEVNFVSAKVVVLANYDRFHIPYSHWFRNGVTLDACKDVTESVGCLFCH